MSEGLRQHVGVNCHLPSAAQLDRVAAAGFGFIRIDVNMDQIRPEPDVWSWAIVDRVVHDATARGLQIYASLAHLPAWCLKGERYPENPEPWVEFVGEVARKYRAQIRYLGIDNEPNAYLTPGQYVHYLLRPAAEAIRQIDAGIRICGPELMTEQTDHGTWAKWLADFAGFLGNCPLDVITVHSYQKNGREVWRQVVGPQTWLMWLKGQTPVREVLRGCGLGEKPLWLCETGWSTDDVSEDAQASYYDQLLESFPGVEQLQKCFVYQHADEKARDGNPPVQWGIMHEDLTPKPAYHTVQRYLAPRVV